ncbi:hypothetical protein ACFSQD_00785 [Flavihumibacter stibioxidans]|uniref:Hydrogenase n=1 Tax=Flavihumibacter stibioxidans TaxID=1834163 RepID=A0ABR7MDE0_9BACT|nr:hydrogenase [Flavihumibacter stibioxidans]MBC6493036.1 hydrogenase [Flavihumibacter stibioxidans]
MQSDKTPDKLIFFGVLLFLAGLIVGFLIPVLANPRMGLSTHLEGVMNGLFLVVLGLIWNRLSLSQKALKTTYALALYGTFANFIAVFLAAITGAGKMMPLAGGKDGGLQLEAAISFLLVSLALAMIAVCILVLKGLYRR